jgi:hypothetical protein
VICVVSLETDRLHRASPWVGRRSRFETQKQKLLLLSPPGHKSSIQHGPAGSLARRRA